MKKNYIFVFALCLLFVQASFGQARDARLKTKGYVNPRFNYANGSSIARYK
jgi:hypothetical protein